MATRFDDETAVTALGGGRFVASIGRGFWVKVGANGGYLCAVMLRALQQAVSDPTRPVRSLGVRFVRPVTQGAVEIETEVVRSGRALSLLCGRMRQAGKLVLEANATFSLPASSISFDDAAMPEATPLERAQPVPRNIELNHRYSMWRALGGELRQSARALTGGWIRLVEPRPVDALLLAALWDAWPPAVFARSIEQRFSGAVPTVEASIFFRETDALTGIDPEQHLLIQVETRKSHEGIVDESSDIWSPDGRLLCQSRQLGLLR